MVDFIGKQNRLPQSYVKEAKKMAEFCQNYSKKKVRASYFLCRYAFKFLSFQNYNKGNFSLNDISSTCMKKDCNNYSKLWELMNQKSMKEYLQIDQNLEFLSKNNIYSVFSHKNKFQNHRAAGDVKSMLDKNIRVLYFTGEFDAYTNPQCFINMLKDVKYKQVDDLESYDDLIGKIQQTKDKNLTIATINYCGNDVTVKNTIASFILLQKF